MPQPAAHTKSTPVERREIIRRAADELGQLAGSSAFVPAYARMNPAAKLTANAFYFGEHGRAPRIVIFGPWAYVHAFGHKTMEGVEQLSEELRVRRHLGALHARVLLDSPEALRILRSVARSLLHRRDASRE